MSASYSNYGLTAGINNIELTTGLVSFRLAKHVCRAISRVVSRSRQPADFRRL